MQTRKTVRRGVAALAVLAVAGAAACGSKDIDESTASNEGADLDGHEAEGSAAGNGQASVAHTSESSEMVDGGGAAGSVGLVSEGGAAGAGEAAGARSSDGVPGAAGTAGTDPPPDTIPPTVLGTAPEDGSRGATSGGEVIITFSEPMDQALTQLAFEAPWEHSFRSWPDDRTMVVVPGPGALEYAEGEHGTDFAAHEYWYTITNVAQDLAGNQLETFTGSFSTLRRVTMHSDGTGLGARPVGYGYCPVQGPGTVCVGNFDTALPVDEVVLGAVGFHLPALPTGAQIESALFTWKEAKRHGSPAGLGALEVSALPFTVEVQGASVSQRQGFYFATATDTVGEMTPGFDSQPLWAVEVKEAVADAYAGDEHYLTLRLAFELHPQNNRDDLVQFVASTPDLDVTYTSP